LIRLLLDQGLPRSTVDFLLGAEWDPVHACQCGLATASDEQILQYARANGRVICTLDADFHALLAVAGASGPSVVRIRREGMRGSEVASLLVRVWSEVSASIERGAVVTVTESAIRLRRLPIGGHQEESGAE
jgi:predicted nuclease of predicted toxin-antitoxin system